MVFKRKSVFSLTVFLLIALSCKHERHIPVKEKQRVKADISVSEFIGGTAVDGTELEVFYAGEKKLAASSHVKNGKAFVELEADSRYDFKLIGKKGKWAGSLIQNRYIGSSGVQHVRMLQLPHAIITRGVTPPEIISVKDKAADKEIKDGFKITDSVTAVTVDFKSETGAVESTSFGGFGAKMAIGTVPDFSSGMTGIHTGTEFKDGIFISKYEFPAGKNFTTITGGENEMVIVGYDIANNRVEKHIKISCAIDEGEINFGETARFKELSMIVERYPYRVNLFSAFSDYTKALNPIGERNSAYVAYVLFSLKKRGILGDVNIPIQGFDIYRRNKGEDEFKLVKKVLYNRQRSSDLHQGFDTSSDLEENKEYEYKITVFNSDAQMQSPVMSVKLMESFTYNLTAPENYKEFTLEEAKNISYTCKIDNLKLLNKSECDFIKSGLIIFDKIGTPQFGAKFKYLPASENEPADALLSVCILNNKIETRSLREMIKNGNLTEYNITKPEDLIKLNTDTGELTITEKFLQIPRFNIIPINSNLNFGKNEAMEYKYGEAYQWDIHAQWGNPYMLTDDEAMTFEKKFRFYYEDGSSGFSYSRAFGNNRESGSNAVNGRFEFSITK